MVYLQPVIDAIQYYSAFSLEMHFSIYDIAKSVTKNQITLEAIKRLETYEDIIYTKEEYW